MVFRIAALPRLFLIILIGLVTNAASPLSPNDERALKPGDNFKECDKCPEMVVVPAGSFMMDRRATKRIVSATRVRGTV